jgi:hypothetical protein
MNRGEVEMLVELINSLPEELRKTYEASIRRSSTVQEMMKLIVAKHLWNNGFRRIAFEKPFSLPDFSMIYVDMYDADHKMCIECEFQPAKNDVITRAEQIRLADPEAKYVLAVHDTSGWKAKDFEGLADEVWVVCRDGRVLSPDEWCEWRKSYVQKAINHEKLNLLIECYREAIEEYKDWYEKKEQTRLTALYWINKVIKAVTANAPTLNYEKFIWRFDDYLNYYVKMMQCLKTEILAETLHAVNRIVQFNLPYVLSLTPDGLLQFEIDKDLEEWLGYEYPKSDDYGYIAKMMEKELTIIKQQANTQKNQSATENITAIGKLCQLIVKAQIDLHNKELSELIDPTIRSRPTSSFLKHF